MKKITAALVAVLICAGLFPLHLQAQQPAFPGAEGAGKFTSGGRGTNAVPTTVFEVTNLTDVNAVGSLRYACSQSVNTYPHRTIVFRVSGTIHLTSRLNIPRNTTIAGQTAPGDGICIADHPVVVNGDNVIVRYLRIRMGDRYQLKTTPANCGVPVSPFTVACMPIENSSGNDDALGNLGGKNIIIDHCSVSWSSDEALTIYRGDSITLQWNFIEEPLNYSYHYEGGADFQEHGYGGIWGAQHASFHHNLIAHCKSRMPRFAGNSTYNGAIESADFSNNVLYNWSLYSVYGGEGGQYNLVNNYYKYGPNSPNSTKYRIVNVDKNDTEGLAKYYIDGNYVDGSPENTADNWKAAHISSGNAADLTASRQLTPYLTDYAIINQSALDAYNAVLMQAGASLPRRDTMDRRIVNDVKFRTGRIIDVQGGFAHGTPYAETVNAWPALNSKPAPTDTDHDGMPDTWENANGLNPNNAADRQTIAANGYTNLENYLNSITNTSPEIDIAGALNAFAQSGNTPSAVQTISISGYNLTGSVVLTAPTGFEISLDGTNWFNSVNPLIVNPGGSNLASTTISIRLHAATAGSYQGNIVTTTTGADAFYISVKGTATEQGQGEPAQAHWLLQANPDATVTGSITATSQTLGGALSGIQYGSSFGGISGWQRTGTAGLLVGYNANAFVEYTISPAPGKFFKDTAITLFALGGGTGTARMAIYYSKDGFATAQSIGPITYNGINYANATDNTHSVSLLNTSTAGLVGQQIARASTDITVVPGETLSIRIYPWITGSGTRYFASQQVMAMGYTGDAATLPLKLLQFGAALKNNQTLLNWKTSEEYNTAGFDIERSEDGNLFHKIAFVAAKNKSVENIYQVTDEQTIKKRTFYRLKMVDRDGTFTHSNVESLIPSKASMLRVYPNPAKSFIQVAHPSNSSIQTLNIFSSDGKLIRNIKVAPNTTQTHILLDAFNPGAYFIKLNGLESKASFIKQ